MFCHDYTQSAQEWQLCPIGVVLAGIEGAEKDRLVVVGDGVDPVRLTVTLRKLTGFADLETVTPSDDNHKEGQHKEGKANKIVLVWPNFSHLLSLPVNISDF